MYKTLYEIKFANFRKVLNVNKIYSGRQHENPQIILYNLYQNGQINETDYMALNSAFTNYQYYIIEELARNPKTRAFEIKDNTGKLKEDFNDIDNYFSTFADIEN